MHIKADGTCRGSGKIYTRFVATKLPNNHTLAIRSNAIKDALVPCSIFEVNQVKECPSQRLFVGVFPNLNVKACDFRLIELDECGNQLDSFTYTLNFTKAKWESRLNYRLNKSLCDEIRDYDRISNYDQADIVFWNCVADENEMILRGAVYTPFRDDSDLTLSCFTDDCIELSIKIVNCGNAKIKTKFSAERYRREQQFSVRLPHQIRRFIFTANDSHHPSFNSFEVLDDKHVSEMLADSSDLMRSAQFDPDYPKWFKSNRARLGELSKQADIRFGNDPLFTIIVPLYNTPCQFFIDMISSVRKQSYANWELILVNASPNNAELSKLVANQVKQDNRIRAISLEKNLGISENTNAGIEKSKGDFICFFDHDDVIEPDLLFTYAEAINEDSNVDLLYCDEDKLLPDGTLTQPFFKPDFDIDLLRNNNYICHMLAIRKSLLNTLEPNTSDFDGAQDHNLTLQAVEHARHVYHAPHILYHWRISENSTASDAESKPYASQAGLKAVRNHLQRMGLKARVQLGNRPFTYKVLYDVPADNPLVSIIIPNKDMVPILDTCIQSVISKTTYVNYEIIIIENNSVDSATFDYYHRIQASYSKIRVVKWNDEFNFSKLMNFGAQHAKGDYLLLLNNDTEVITPNWLEIMLGICAREDVGIVGAKLYYPDNTIQHAGVYVTGGCAGHIGRNLPRNSWGYFAFLDSQRELSAVTAACLMTDRTSFESVGGFTEELTVAFNDVDYCLKVREKGKLVVYSPDVELYHYESISRGAENNSAKRIRFHREVAYMNFRWADYYILGDPYHNINLAQDDFRSMYSGLAPL